MTARLEFFFDYGSPWSYIANARVPAVAERAQAELVYRPMLLGGVFKATGNVSPAVSLAGIKNKGEYAELEIRRFLVRHGIRSYVPNPFFPVNTLQIMRGAVAAQRLGCYARYVDEVYRHMWSDPKKMDDPRVIQAALEESGLPAAELLALAVDPSVKQQLIDNTERSVARGTFGSPSFYVGDELFFGKDRLREVEEEIEAQKEARR
jgi:2-hydroxychromene-2-carboxylate isomerase